MFRSLIPKIIKDRKMSISDFQRRSGLGWSHAHGFATNEYIPPGTTLNTMHSIAKALGVLIDNCYSSEKQDSSTKTSQIESFP